MHLLDRSSACVRGGKVFRAGLALIDLLIDRLSLRGIQILLNLFISRLKAPKADSFFCT